MNIDDIIRSVRRNLYEEGKNPSDYTIHWGKEGAEALEKLNYTKRGQGMTFLGIKHRWDKSKEGYTVK